MKHTTTILFLLLALLLCSCSPLEPVVYPTITPISTLRPSATTVPTQTYGPSKTPVPSKTPTKIMTPTLTPTLRLYELPTTSVEYDSTSIMTNECRRIVDQMYIYHEMEDFTPDMYFQFLTHLRLEDGYQLDYATVGDDMGYLAFVYARKTSDPAFKTYEEYLASLDEETKGKKSWSGSNYSNAYLSKVEVDGTPEGYFEFAALAMLGDQFNLYWHGLYNDTKIMCDVSDMDYVNEDLHMFDWEDEVFTLPPEILLNANYIDYTPAVVMDANTVTIRFVSFSKWGGFTESVYVVDKFDPYHIIEEDFNKIIDYDCGIDF
jgi:hypothetical protein